MQCANRCVPGCGLKFYRFPADPKRRALWITKINRKNWQPNEYSWLCSSHFISGQKSDDPLSPDYVPSIFDYTSTPEKQKASADLVAYERRKESRKKRVNAAAMEETSAPKRRRCLADEGFRNAETMTDTSGCYMSWLEVENIRLSHENKQLDSECQVLRLQHQKLFDDHQKVLSDNARLKSKLSQLTWTEEGMKDSDEKVKFYTGLSSFTVLMAVFNLLAPQIPDHQRHAITKYQQFIMVLMKLRLNLSEVDLGYRFGVNQSTVCRLFSKWIKAMYTIFQPLVKWPGHAELYKTQPIVFRKNFRKCIAIIDCFEVFCERPTTLKARAQTWSNYKHHNTVKFLIGIAPQGAITFISHGWGGRVSDQHLTENCGILEHLHPGDQILADRGFNVQESASLYCAEVKIPPFTRGKKQLSKLEVDTSRELSHVRIHVERVIGVLRQKYTILQGTLPISLIMSHSSNAESHHSLVDMIVVVCCALCNCCPSVIPFE